VSLGQLRHWYLAPENAAKLDSAGLTIAFTAHGLKDIGQFLSAVRKTVERGLGRDAALAALTSHPAAIVGKSGEFGSLGVGKSASFVVATGDLNMTATGGDPGGFKYDSQTGKISIARMQSPAGWEEPGQTPEFDEYTVVLKGTLRVETKKDDFYVHQNQAIMVGKGEWVRYSSPEEEGAEYIAICIPAFSPETVNRDDKIPES